MHPPGQALLTLSNDNIKYYIRTKDKRVVTNNPPKWFTALNSIELLILGREVSSQYDPPGRLLTRAGEITQHVQELLDNLRKNNNINNIVFASTGLEVVALLNKHCFVAPSIEHNDLEGVGFTTSLFASLTYELETTDWIQGTEDDHIDDKKIVGIQETLRSVIGNARKYANVPTPESLRSAPIVPPPPPTTTANRRVEVKYLGSWDHICKEWEAANDTGIILKPNEDKKKEKWLDVWRGSTTLPGYVARIGKKQKAIGEIWKMMLPICREGDVRRHVSILLQGDPGVGKTFLAQKLAENLGFEAVAHDITQMIHRDDLLSFFDTIATHQAESKKPLLVFVDEINATLDGDPVYGAFLAPIEGGYYIRTGVKYKRRPCVWLFAGTGYGGNKKGDKDGDREFGSKHNDFDSRLSLKVRIDYKSLLDEYCRDVEDEHRRERGQKKLQKEAQLEQVYMGAMMIHVAFPDVAEIEESVLNEFRRLARDKSPARTIRKRAWSLKNVQHRRVTEENCEEWGVFKHKESEDEDMVKLNFG